MSSLNTVILSRLNDFKNDYLENEFDTVKSITGMIELALRNLTTNVNIIESEEVVSALESIYKKELMLELGLDAKNTSDEFAAPKGWLMELSGIFKTNPIKLRDLKPCSQATKRSLICCRLKMNF